MEGNLEVFSTAVKVPHKYNLSVSRVLGDAGV